MVLSNTTIISICFTNSLFLCSVVQNVLKRKHKVNGANLTLKLHRPIPCYKNRFLVTGVSSTTNKENLMLFMEARARGSNVTEVLYGEEPGKALVTFEDHNFPGKR